MLSSMLAGLARRVFGHGGRLAVETAEAHVDPGSATEAAADGNGHGVMPDAQPESLLRAGVAEAQAGRHAAARSLLCRVVSEMPQNPDALEALANVELLLGQVDAAEALYRRALAIDSSVASRWANLALCLRAMGRLHDAGDALKCSLAIDPAQPGARLNRALVAIDRGGFDEGEQQLRALLGDWPHFAEAHTALAHVMLVRGRFRDGWHEYEWRLRLPDAAERPALPVPHWDGTPGPDKTLLITAEQGLGDQMMLLSCVPDAAARLRQCWLECDARLQAIARRSFPNVRVLPYRRQRDEAWLKRVGQPDVQIALGSLPKLFRDVEEAFPRQSGYLHADPVRVDAWRARLAELGPGPKVGLSWRGGAPTTRGVLRSIPLRGLRPIIDTAPAVFVSLQYGDCSAELAAAQACFARKLWHFPEAIADYDETAALVAALDRVITVQTAVAHLAGALGKGVWIMLPIAPEWRYGASGERLCWYPSARLFRQARCGDWDAVIARVANAMRDDAGAQL